MIDLCDEILGLKAERQYNKFALLLGDKNASGKQRKLPVDAYYSSLNVVIEYREEQHSIPVPYFDKPHKRTISGVHRGEQRKLYDQRRRDLLPKNGIRLIELSYELFTCDSRNRIVRIMHSDKIVLQKLLKEIKIKH